MRYIFIINLIKDIRRDFSKDLVKLKKSDYVKPNIIFF